MARMRRIQIVMDPGLDDWLEREAAARGMSKSALVRECVRDEADRAEPYDNGLWKLLELAPLFADSEPVDDIDTELYGPLETP